MFPMNKTIDLHVHSTASDGTFTPTELVTEAKRCGLSAFALTDHDTVDGISEALAAGEASGFEVIPGVELSTEYNETEIHVVGLFIDPANTELQAELAKFRDNRDNRNLKMIEKLQEEGFRITAEDLYRLNPDTVVARPHIARYLVDSGQVKDLKTVFDKYIGDGCKCYVDRYKITPMQAVALIHQAGGLAILAHPCLYKMKRAELTAMIEELVAAGLNGIEVVYSCNQGSDEKDFRAMAEKYHLLLSGGSDFHGANKPYIHLGTGKGTMSVPHEFLEAMRTSFTK